MPDDVPELEAVSRGRARRAGTPCSSASYVNEGSGGDEPVLASDNRPPLMLVLGGVLG
jgi:hypothetical protein